ncbi:MAG: response regulator [Pirellulaceae bacterium]
MQRLPAESTAHEPLDAPTPPCGAGRLVLIVDDDPDFLLQHSTVFKSLGFEVLTAASRDQAQAALGRHPLALAVVDLMMEESDSGFTLCHEIKRQHPQTPIVVVTSASSLTGYDFESLSGDQRKWVQADAVLAKPIRFDQLKAQVNRLLDR